MILTPKDRIGDEGEGFKQSVREPDESPKGVSKEEWSRLKANESYLMYAKLDKKMNEILIRIEMLEEKTASLLRELKCPSRRR